MNESLNPLHKKSCPGELQFTIGIVIKSDIRTVWNNVCKADKVKKYFTTDARRDLDSSGDVLWIWGNEAAMIKMIEVFPEEKLIFEWNGSNVDYRIRTEFIFKSENGKVTLKIKEKGWEINKEGISSSYLNCSGWTEFLSALKVFTEYDISYLK
ncbi:MAG: SRPBCC domain-containing protein [Ignavibacteria bacterium]|nr:SRPBCC domain-containing protein [Ignavibacteria bacterium]